MIDPTELETLEKFNNWFEIVRVVDDKVTFSGRFGKSRSATKSNGEWFYSGAKMEDLTACIRFAGMDLD